MKNNYIKSLFIILIVLVMSVSCRNPAFSDLSDESNEFDTSSTVEDTNNDDGDSSGNGDAASDNNVESTGDGSLKYPFLIYNEDDLRQVGTGIDSWDLDKHYKVMENFSVEEPWYNPIGTYPNNSFTGSLDGNNLTISGLTIVPTMGDLALKGLFGYIGDTGLVKNLTITNSTIIKSAEDEGASGGFIAGWNNGKIVNCSVTKSQITGGSCIGGIVGRNDGQVEYCYSDAVITGESTLGGIVGNNNGSIKRSFATGDVTGTSSEIGGIVGTNDLASSRIENCYSTGNVSGGENVGGIVGRNDGLVQSCYASGTVSSIFNSVFYTGGIAGENFSGANISNCVALSPTINFNMDISRVGRVAGKNAGGLSNNYAQYGMKMIQNGNELEYDVSDTDGKDGVTISDAEWDSSAWWQNAGFAADAWNLVDNSLPTLKGYNSLQ